MTRRRVDHMALVFALVLASCGGTGEAQQDNMLPAGNTAPAATARIQESACAAFTKA